MSLRRTKLPFSGFYENNMFLSGIDNQIENMKDVGMSPESIEEQLEAVDYSDLYKRVTSRYAEILADDINDMLNTEIILHDPDYVGNAGYQSVDKLTAVIDLSKLPSTQVLHKTLCDKMDFNSGLIEVAGDRFNKEYSEKMKELLSKQVGYSLWGGDYIECLLIVLEQAVAINLDLAQEKDGWSSAILAYEEGRLLEDCICDGLLTDAALYSPESY